MIVMLQKLIASTGYCSRRQAQELIRDGRVKIDDMIASLGMRADENSQIFVDDQLINAPVEKIYLKLNKPVGYTCTNRHFSGEKNIFDLVSCEERLFVVGRLDKNSRGLVVLTNDGDWAFEMSHPRFGHEKEYIVSIDKKYSLSGDEAYAIIEKLRAGVDIGESDGRVKAKKVRYLGNNIFNVILSEGRKRQIRRMMQVVGLEVRDLERVRLGDILLGELVEGKTESIDKNQIL